MSENNLGTNSSESKNATDSQSSSAVRIEMPGAVFVATVTGEGDREYLAELITALYGILSERTKELPCKR